MVFDHVWHIGFRFFRFFRNNHGFGPVSKMRFSVTSKGTRKNMHQQINNTCCFHVAPCLWVLYFVVYVSNSAFGARRENMWVFGVVFGCLYLSCCSPCVLLANDINGKPDKVRPADYQLNWKMLAGWSPGVLFANDISWQTRHRETSRLPAGLKNDGWLAGFLMSCLLMTFNGKTDTGRPANHQLNWKTLAGWSPGVLFANDI